MDLKNKIVSFFVLSIMAYCLWLFFTEDYQNDYLKLLVFSKTKGFRHVSIEDGKKMFESLAERNGFEVIFSEESEVFNERFLSDINVIVFLIQNFKIFNNIY